MHRVAAVLDLGCVERRRRHQRADDLDRQRVRGRGCCTPSISSSSRRAGARRSASGCSGCGCRHLAERLGDANRSPDDRLSSSLARVHLAAHLVRSVRSHERSAGCGRTNWTLKAKDTRNLIEGLTTLTLIAGLFLTARRHNGWAGLHDLASGTRVVSRSAARLRTRIAPAAAPRRSTPQVWRSASGTGLSGR